MLLRYCLQRSNQKRYKIDVFVPLIALEQFCKCHLMSYLIVIFPRCIRNFENDLTYITNETSEVEMYINLAMFLT